MSPGRTTLRSPPASWAWRGSLPPRACSAPMTAAAPVPSARAGRGLGDWSTLHAGHGMVGASVYQARAQHALTPAGGPAPSASQENGSAGQRLHDIRFTLYTIHVTRVGGLEPVVGEQIGGSLSPRGCFAPMTAAASAPSAHSGRVRGFYMEKESKHNFVAMKFSAQML